jgi:hypothetical protein
MTKAKTTRSGSANTPYCPTLIEFILDETGSMSGCKNAVIDGFNAFLDEQRALETPCALTLTKFDTCGLRTPFTDLGVGMVPYLTPSTFLPNSGTNLHDAIGMRTTALAERLAAFATRPNALVVVMTDGEENGSHTWSQQGIRELIGQHTALGVTFVYLGSTPYALSVAANLGFAPGNARQFEASRTRETFTDLARAATAYRATRTVAATTSNTFFAN